MFDHLISTLFPYTTLFRSVSVDHGWHGASLSLQHPMPRGATAFGWIGAGRASKVVNGAVTQLEQMADCGPGSDRKSTRLNSSHVAISDALFCVKKERTRET